MSEGKTLVKNTIVISFGTFLSRITGLAREVLISSLFGATWITDAFLIAYTIPNLLRRLFAEGALSTSIVPVFSPYFVGDKDRRNPQDFVASVFTGFSIVVGLICLLGILLAPWIIKVVAIGFRNDLTKVLVVTDFTRIMFPFLLLISWSAFAMGILNTVNVFSWSSLAPVFFNLGTIFALLFLRPYVSFYALAWGVVLGGLWQFIFQLPPLYRKGFRLQIKLDFFRDEGFRQVVGLMLPVTFSLAVSQLNTLVDRIIASLCEEVAVSALYFADRLMELPLGVFGIALSTAILPSLSQKACQDNLEEWKGVLWQGIRWILFIMVPVSIFLLVFSSQTVSVVYQRGVFGGLTTRMTASALFFYALGLTFFSLAHLFTRAFYSLKDSKTPVRVGVMAVALNIVLDLVLVRYLSFNGLALATSLAAVFNFVALWVLMQKKYCRLNLPFQARHWYQKVIVQGVLLAVFCMVLVNAFRQSAERFHLTSFVLLVVFVALFYLLLGFFLKVGEHRLVLSLWQELRGRFRK
ncbi:MAG: murein biosynthesis integral membrane protein MurJ [Candidatus Atribacteria bacterium]|nr:murein biosynthesis integral membrane protein MurJ [Candidatus Atribacteria bacterium]